MAIEISLSKGQVALVDDEDARIVRCAKWFALWRPKSKTYYAARNLEIEGYPKRLVFMHRWILGIDDDRIEIDHRDHNGLNNCRSNLRICNHTDNVRNRRGWSGAFKGTRKRPSGKWEARIRANGKLVHLGTFNTEQEAAMAYNAKAEELFGEFYCPNVLGE